MTSDKPKSWAEGANTYGPAPAGQVCCRCDKPIRTGADAVRVPGLTARGWAHPACLPAR